MPKTYKTREEWLVEFTRRAQPVFKRHGYEIPKVRMAVGFTSKGAKTNRIGECWTNRASEDGACEIFITPLLSDASRIADILTHELIHAVLGTEVGHKKPFVDAMKKLGLTGKPTATIAGPGWHEWADKIVSALGPLPHAALVPGGNGEKKQTTRLIKCECSVCGFTFRAAAKWLETDGELACPNLECRGPLSIG